MRFPGGEMRERAVVVGAAVVVSLVLAGGISLPVAAASFRRGIDDSFFRPGGALDEAGGTPSAAAEANPAAPTVRRAAKDLLVETLKMTGALLFVIALIFATSRFLRKGRLPFFRDGLIRRIAAEPLSGNNFLHVVEIGGKVLVLSVGEKGVGKIAELEGEAADRVKLWDSRREGEGRGGGEESARPTVPRESFRRALSRFIEPEEVPRSATARNPLSDAAVFLERERERLAGLGWREVRPR
ncbi:MAG: hypothetical protein D6679_04450 [Candidatus Hydrogenedentota bacterium]|nr:MAG: hypothetical protein D6679_04450 [Candidatus Hydrogenedentota bacterium]